METASDQGYSADYIAWKRWGAGRFGSYDMADAIAFGAELSRAGVSANASVRILELGYGNGTFLAWARDAGYQCDGVEVNPVLHELGLGAGFRVFDGIERVPADPGYQLIVAFDVIEHIADGDLPAFFRAVNARLAGEGMLLTRSPNGDSPFGLPYQNGDITHRSAIGAHKIRQLSSLGGFEVAYILPPATPLASARPMRRVKLRVLQFLKSAFEYLIGRLYFDGERVYLDPNLVALLRRVQEPPLIAQTAARGEGSTSPLTGGH